MIELASFWPLAAGTVLLLLAAGLVAHPWLPPFRTQDPVAAYARRLNFYTFAMVLLLASVALVAFFAVTLHKLSVPWEEEAFGLSVALMLVTFALIFHILELSYRDRAIATRRRTV